MRSFQSPIPPGAAVGAGDIQSDALLLAEHSLRWSLVQLQILDKLLQLFATQRNFLTCQIGYAIFVILVAQVCCFSNSLAKIFDSFDHSSNLICQSRWIFFGLCWFCQDRQSQESIACVKPSWSSMLFSHCSICWTPTMCQWAKRSKTIQKTVHLHWAKLGTGNKNTWNSWSRMHNRIKTKKTCPRETVRWVQIVHSQKRKRAVHDHRKIIDTHKHASYNMQRVCMTHKQISPDVQKCKRCSIHANN